MNFSSFPISQGSRLRCLFILALAGLFASGCKHDPPPKYLPEFYMEAAPNAGRPITLPVSGLSYNMQPKPFLTEGDVVNVDLVKVDLGYCLMFTLTDAGSRELYRQSVQNMSKRIFLLVNGKPIGVHPIEGAMQNGAIYVWMEMPQEELIKPDFVNDFKDSLASIEELKLKSGGR